MYKVVVDKRALVPKQFKFYIKTDVLTVEIAGEIQSCEEPSSTKCTIIIAVLASLCLLLFAGLALTLIVLKEKRIPCMNKFSNWFRSETSNSAPSANRSSGIEATDLEQYVFELPFR